MHVLPAVLIGFIFWVLVLMFCTDWLYAIGAGPLVVSGVALVLCLGPLLIPTHRSSE